MPIYEFACRSCAHRFEELVKANGSSPIVPCPSCGSDQTLRLTSAFAVRSTSSSGDLAGALSGGRASGGCCGGACGCG